MTKTKKLMALLLVVAMLFTFVSVIAACQPQDECEKNGHTLTAVAQKDATLQEAGYEAYWKCDVCGKLFSDKDGKNEISKPVEIPQLTPEPTPHVCGHKCPTCGKCTDATCTDPVCASKCPGHQTVDKGKTQDNPLTPEEAIALMDEAGNGKVVNPTNKDGYYIQGVVNAGSTIDTQYHEWKFTLGTGEKVVTCQAKIDSSVTDKPAEKDGALDGATIIIKGFIELYYSKYQCSYLPASASPTGAKFTPSIVDVQISFADVESITLNTPQELNLLPIENNTMGIKATISPDKASQDVDWNSSDTSVATVQDFGPTCTIRLTGKSGSTIITATAAGTTKSASVTINVEGSTHGTTEEDPLTVDEAITKLDEKGNLIADDSGVLYYVRGVVDAGSTLANARYAFTVSNTDKSKKLTCDFSTSAFGKFNVKNGDGALDGCTVLFHINFTKEDDIYSNDKGAVENVILSCTFPALQAIEIEAEKTEVILPYSVEITVKSITPASAVFENAEWISSDETKATVSGDTVKATVKTISAGEVKISVKCGDVTSNEITLTLTEEQKAIKAVYDWTDGLTADTVCSNTYYTVSLPKTDMVSSHINVWTPDQTEILTMLATNGKTVRDGKGIGFYPGKASSPGSIDFTTVHQIKKISFKIIPYSDATMVQFSVNGKEYSEEKGDKTWDGKLTSAIDVTLDLTEASNTLKFEKNGTKGNNFVIVGMTLETEATGTSSITYDWADGLTADTVCSNTYYTVSLPKTDMVSSHINVWTPDQTEILTMLATNGKTVRDGKGIGFYPGKASSPGSIDFTTVHQIKKISFKIIPYSDATMVQFSVNGKEYSEEKGDKTWDGKLTSAIDVTLDLTEASNTLKFEKNGAKGNNFVIVGMTLEW